MPALRKVLLLDDDRAVSKLPKYLLKDTLYHVFSATYRMEAMEIALQRVIDRMLGANEPVASALPGRAI